MNKITFNIVVTLYFIGSISILMLAMALPFMFDEISGVWIFLTYFLALTIVATFSPMLDWISNTMDNLNQQNK